VVKWTKKKKEELSKQQRVWVH